MPQRKITRRAFGLLLPTTALFAQNVANQTPTAIERDGDAWKTSSDSLRLGYVLGFTDAANWAGTNVEAAVRLLKSLSSADRKLLAEGKEVWDYGGIRFEQLIEGMNSFYGDYRNAAIKWDRALSFVRDTIRGEPQDYLEKELEFERKLALSEEDEKK